MNNPKPKPGDIWEVRRPDKPKITKEVGHIAQIWNYITKSHVPYVWWRRAPKGRYSGISVRNLMKWGTRLETRAERTTRIEARWAELHKR